MTSTEVLAVDQRFRSPALLLFGSASTVIGFFTITVIGIIDFLNRIEDGQHHKYDSGHGYWPSTVSEMVHDRDSPGGKVFYSFGMMAGACIFVSQYPFHLRSVYTGNETIPGTTIYWTSVRQLCPSMGLWLLIGINTYPTQIAVQSEGHTKMFCVILHLLGAGMMFGGYTICELKCLGMLGFTKHLNLAIERREHKVRTLLAWTILLGFVGFSAMQFLLAASKKLGLCCPDDWLMKGEEVDGHRIRHVQVKDTASGTVLFIKILSFVFEDVAGVSLVLSHLAIWYYCEERRVHYGAQRMREVHHQEDN